MGVLAAVVTFFLVPKPLPEFARHQFLVEVRAGHVRQVVIEDEQVIVATSSKLGKFRTAYDRTADRNLAGELRAMKVEVLFETSPPGI